MAGGMRCSHCDHSSQYQKLSEEFLEFDVTSACSHFRSACIQCLHKYAELEGKCLLCDASLSPQEMEILTSRHQNLSLAVSSRHIGKGDKVCVTTMLGTTSSFDFTSEMTVHDLKALISVETGLDATKCRLLFRKESKELFVRKRGSTERLTLSHFGVGPGDALQLIQFISNHAGKTSVDGAQVDVFGNVLGSQYDLGVDGGFTGLRIAVLQFYTQGFDFKLPQDVLEGKGFTVHRWTTLPGIQEFKDILGKSCQLWIISDQTAFLQAPHVQAISSFFEEGKGLFLWGDNDPYFADANLIGSKLLNTTMDGNVLGDKAVKLKKGGLDTPESGFLLHDITTGLQTLYEGITIATIRPGSGSGVKPLMFGSAPNLVTAYYDENGRRCILDGGFTRLFYKWDEAGQPRVVVNCAAWLANMEALQ